MGIRTNFYPMGKSGKRQYTLTVNVIDSNNNPLTAQITLNGITTTGSTASITVDENEIVGYSIVDNSHPSATGGTGSVTMTENKTITAQLQYTTSSIKVVDTSQLTAVGSPTISSAGIASGFSASNYYKFTPTITSSQNGQTVKIKTKATLNSYVDSNLHVIFSTNASSSSGGNYGWTLGFRNGSYGIIFTVGNGSATRTASSGSAVTGTYWIEASWGISASNGIQLKYSADGTSWSTATNSIGTCSYAGSNYALSTMGACPRGVTRNFYFNGSIDLLESEIEINGSTWWRGYSYQTSYSYYWQIT